VRCGPALQTLQGSGEGLGKGLSDHVGIDRPQIAPDGCQELVIREQGGCRFLPLSQPAPSRKSSAGRLTKSQAAPLRERTESGSKKGWAGTAAPAQFLMEEKRRPYRASTQRGPTAEWGRGVKGALPSQSRHNRGPTPSPLRPVAAIGLRRPLREPAGRLAQAKSHVRNRHITG
jgi:hypothetical protein